MQSPMPVGPPPVWAPPRRRPPGAIVGLVLVGIVTGAVVMVSTLGGFGGFPAFGILVFAIVLLLAAAAAVAGGFQRRSLPPPPPIQQPMVPAGTQGPVSLECPNCGAPPTGIDRFGVAACTYCGTRFLVR